MRLKKFITEWMLPPGIKGWLNELIYGRKIRFKKFWRFQPIAEGLHDLPFFSEISVKPLWLSLNKEARAGIIATKKVLMKKAFKIKPAQYLQLGIGSDCDQDIKQVEVFVNKKTAGYIKNFEKGFWHDIRIPLEGIFDEIQIEVHIKGKGKLFLSHPIIGQNKPTCKAPKRPRNIICIVVDGIIPHYLTPERTPNIMRFFSKGITCNRVYSQSNWTLPAFTSMLTGQYPLKHGVYNPDICDKAVRKEDKTLPELLKAEGYRTFGYSSHLRFSPSYGHARGFDRFVFKPTRYGDFHINAIHETINQLEAHKQEPNFCFLHIFDTHPPYQPTTYLKNSLMKPKRINGAYSQAKKLGIEGYESFILDECWAKLTEIDFALKSLFSYVEEPHWINDTVVILTSDHGTVHMPISDPLFLPERVHIPLLLRGISAEQDCIDSFIEGSIDLMPSVLNIAGIESPQDIDGRLWPFLGGEPRKKVFSEALFKEKYEACLRDERFSYHLKCPFNQTTGEIFYEQRKPLSIFKRLDGCKEESISSDDVSSRQHIEEEFRRIIFRPTIMDAL